MAEFGREQLLAGADSIPRAVFLPIPFGIAISIMGTRELWLSVVQPGENSGILTENCPPPHAAVPQPLKRKQLTRQG